jgi:hypothetical protein
LQYNNAIISIYAIIKSTYFEINSICNPFNS